MKTYLIVFFLFINLNAQEIPGEHLLNIFSSTCNEQGDWTRSVLEDAQSLIKVIDTISKDPNCQSVAGAISQLNNLVTRVNEINQLNNEEFEISKLNENEQLLFSKLNQTTDLIQRDNLSSYISNIQLERFNVLSRQYSKNKHFAPKKEKLFSQIMKSTDTMLYQITQNQACTQENPAVLSSAFSIAGSIASAATIANPLLSFGIAAGSDFLGSVAEKARQYKYAKKIKKISQGSIALEGYKCALQSLNSKWCTMNDAESFLDFRRDLRHADIHTDLLNSIKLLEIEIPSLLDWLNNVRSGTKASTSADANRQKNVIQRQRSLLVSSLEFHALIEENKALFNKAVSEQEKYDIIKKTISTITGSASPYSQPTTNGAGTNPLSDIYDFNYAPYYLLGLERSEVPSNGFGGFVNFSIFDPFSQWPNGPYVPTYSPLLSNQLQKWIDLATKRVNDEFSVVLQPDAIQVLSSSYDETSNSYKVSAKTSLEKIIHFIEINKPELLKNGAFRKLYVDLQSDLKEINKLIDNALLNDSSNASDAVSEIYVIGNLEFGTVVIQSRLNMLVRTVLIDKIKNEIPKQRNATAQLLAADRFKDLIFEISGSNSYTKIKTDIMRAKPINQHVMTSFVDAFSKNIKQTLNFLIDKEKQAAPTQKLEYKRSRTELCMALLGVEHWPSKIPKHLCINLKLQSYFQDGPSSELITMEKFNEPLEKRACTYHNFMRNSLIFERWEI